jgi:hypothetical protein
MKILATIAMMVAVWFLTGWYMDTPLVYRVDEGTTPVACATAESDWHKVAFTDPACSEVLDGRHEVVWVSPEWRP